jgi:hypothetical protein
MEGNTRPDIFLTIPCKRAGFSNANVLYSGEPPFESRSGHPLFITEVIRGFPMLENTGIVSTMATTASCHQTLHSLDSSIVK